MIVLQLLFIQLVVFGLLMGLLIFLIKKHMVSASSHIQELTEDCGKKLADAKKKMDEANAYHNEVVAKAREEGEKEKQKLIQEGSQQKEEMLRQGRKQSEEITNRANVAAENILNELNQKIEVQSLKKTAEIVERLFAGSMKEETHSQWIAELIKNGLNDLKRLNVSEDIHEIQAVSAFPLKPAERTSIKTDLSHKLGKNLEMKEQVDPQLILGLRLTVGRIVIDGSLQSKIQELLRNSRADHS